MVQPSSRPPAHGRSSRWAALSLRLSTSLSPWQRSPRAWHVMNQGRLPVSQRQLLQLPPQQARVHEPGCSLARVLVYKPAPHGWTPQPCGPQRQLPAVWPPALQLPLPLSRQSFMLASLPPRRNGTAQGRPSTPDGWRRPAALSLRRAVRYEIEDMSYERLLRLDEGNMQRQSLPARVVDKFQWVTVVSTASCECSICLEDLRAVVAPTLSLLSQCLVPGQSASIPN